MRASGSGRIPKMIHLPIPHQGVLSTTCPDLSTFPASISMQVAGSWNCQNRRNCQRSPKSEILRCWPLRVPLCSSVVLMFAFPIPADPRSSALSFFFAISRSSPCLRASVVRFCFFRFRRCRAITAITALLACATSSCSAPAPPADTPANYVSSTQSCRSPSHHVRASQS